jgi:hypothetical protein
MEFGKPKWKREEYIQPSHGIIIATTVWDSITSGHVPSRRIFHPQLY